MSVALGALAALVYSSWPLGFILNPVVSRHALASELEAPHQPYDWVFVALDVLTGVLILGVGLLQIKISNITRDLQIGVACYIAFGCLVATAALMPLHCDPQVIGSCGPLIHNPLVLLHGICSILSVVMLLVAVMLIVKALYDAHAPRLVRAFFAGIAGCWVVFGIGSLMELTLRIHNNNLLQYFFITVCSVSIVLIVVAIEYLARPAWAPAKVPARRV